MTHQSRARQALSSPRLCNLFVASGLIAALLLNTGCATYLLWDNEFFDNRKEPANDPRVKLFEDERKDDYLVQYLEADESSGKVRYRIYYILENDLAVTGGQKPQFLRHLPDSNLTEIPVLPHPADTNDFVSPALVFAVMSEGNNGFTICLADGSKIYSQLPEYSGKIGRIGRILLTPITLAIDTGVTAAVIYVLLKADSHEPSWYD